MGCVVLHPGGVGQTIERPGQIATCQIATLWPSLSLASMLAPRSTRRPTLPTLVIRNIDDTLHARLKEYAAAHGNSMEEEVRRILRDRLAVAPQGARTGWVDAIRALVEPLGGIDLPALEREKLRDPPDYSGPEWGSEM